MSSRATVCHSRMNSNRIYDDLAHLWTLISAPEDYADEARYWRAILREFVGWASPTTIAARTPVLPTRAPFFRAATVRERTCPPIPTRAREGTRFPAQSTQRSLADTARYELPTYARRFIVSWACLMVVVARLYHVPAQPQELSRISYRTAVFAARGRRRLESRVRCSNAL